MPYVIWPVPGFYRVSSGFRTMERPDHMGIDIGRNITPPQAILGADIVAVADGRVSAISAAGAHHQTKGNWIELDHGGGLRTRYKHNLRNKVKFGQYVRQGDVIALVGDTGRSFGPHLHFEIIYNGRHMDPLDLLCPNRQTDVDVLEVEILEPPAVAHMSIEPVNEIKSRMPLLLSKIMARIFSLR